MGFVRVTWSLFGRFIFRRLARLGGLALGLCRRLTAAVSKPAEVVAPVASALVGLLLVLLVYLLLGLADLRLLRGLLHGLHSLLRSGLLLEVGALGDLTVLQLPLNAETLCVDGHGCEALLLTPVRVETPHRDGDAARAAAVAVLRLREGADLLVALLLHLLNVIVEIPRRVHSMVLRARRHVVLPPDVLVPAVRVLVLVADG